MKTTFPSMLVALGLCLGLSSVAVNANTDIEDYVSNAWQHRALLLQGTIDIDTPLREASILMTHNSFNSDHYSNLFSYLDPNQKHSITEQLDMGVRLVELDSHWYSGDILACHAGDDHIGCSSYDGLIEDRIAEVNSWMRRPEHSDQVVFVYIEDHLDDHYTEASLILNKYFADKIYAPSSCNGSLPTDLTKADILNAGKQVVIFGGSYSCTAASGTDWGNYVHGGFFKTDNSGLSAAPDCSANTFDPNYIAANITRVFEDSTTLSEWFGDPPPDITSAYMKTLVDCGINIMGLDQLDDADSRHGAAIWSWDTNEPNDYGSGEDCAVHKSNGRLNDVSCSNNYTFACLDSAGDWQISSTVGNWSEGVLVCSSEFGGSFGMPKNGYQNYLLGQAQGSDSVWVAYSDGALENRWVVGDTINEIEAVNFNNHIVESYGGGQDASGGATIESGGAGLRLSGNSWKKIALPYTVTVNTVLEFDFSSDAQGEIHGIGFDDNNSISSSYTFKVHGTQGWGIRDFDNYAGGTTHYKISVGNYYSGYFDYLFFTMDHDSGASGNGLFSNIKIYETTDPALTLPPEDDSIVYRQLKNGKGKCLDLEGKNTGNGTTIHQWSCHTSNIDSQLWYQDKTGRIHSKLNPDKCVDVSGSGTSEGSDIHLWSCHDGDNQRWLRGTNNSWRPAHAPGMAMDINGANGNNGSDSHLWTYHGGKSQMWFWFSPATSDRWIP